MKWDVNQNECCCNEKLFDHGISNDCHAQSEFYQEPQHCQQNLSHLPPGLQLSDGLAKPYSDGSRLKTSNDQNGNDDWHQSFNRSSKSVKIESFYYTQCENVRILLRLRFYMNFLSFHFIHKMSKLEPLHKSQRFIYFLLPNAFIIIHRLINQC